MTKRLFDFIAAGLGLLVLSPVFLIVALLIKLDSHGPVFFKQERIGKGFQPFLIYKFRTMVHNASASGQPLTVGNDPRITKVGGFLRKGKIDELPQLLNVLKGDMTFVGPRPEVPEFVQLFKRDYEEILTARPGITDLASIDYHDESTLLGQSKDAREIYVTRILPDKIRLAKEYLHRSSFFFDMGLILKTLLRLFTRSLSL
jgi:lipopolysaccharide/colanic/teichoic acid biosynthesis glycosyltransferase